MKTITYSIPNISCGHCVHTIQSELSEVSGVTSEKPDRNTKKTITVSELPATEELIKAKLVEINYPVAN